jgi:hypothetical protein
LAIPQTRVNIGGIPRRGFVRVKFNQLPPGTRFSYRGKTYRKVSPLQGASEIDGKRTLIPRSANVGLLDADGAEIATDLPQMLPRSVVECVLEDYRRRLRSSLAMIESALDDDQLAGLRTAIESADSELWTQLALRSAIGENAGPVSEKTDHS